MSPKIIAWVHECLLTKGYSLNNPAFETIQITPWSCVLRFSTSKGDIYLKQTPRALFLEPKIIQILDNQCHASVPLVIASNEQLCCFLMKDAGEKLREYLKPDLQVDLLCHAMTQFAAIQKSTQAHLGAFLALGVPDWRLNKLPDLYENLIKKEKLLKAEGISDQELQQLQNLIPQFSAQCQLLSQYTIDETIVQPDFNTNNMLIDLKTKKLTLVDLGETVISHPFFCAHNYLFQATVHHGVKESDHSYQQLQAAYLENWLNVATNQKLHEAFNISKKIWPIYGALAYYRLMISVDLPALKLYYAKRSSALAAGLKAYIMESII